ncbi:hypothetical protein ACFFLM_08850 [Deinococcus oregonensis]|uniref:UmuC domain-containing protein n=1 Tax=Deinococcus oregonensis TaxID=1805970 RepID=A0ABV6AX25_9DEIO
MRKIVHVDADVFYASVELRDQPYLRGQPLAVADHGPRSVVTMPTYEARQFGVHSALPLQTALAHCPGLIAIEPRMDVYREASRMLPGVFYTLYLQSPENPRSGLECRSSQSRRSIRSRWSPPNGLMYLPGRGVVRATISSFVWSIVRRVREQSMTANFS